jgi:hypothetical protein
MPAKADRRGDPQVLWPDAKSVVVLGLNYGPESDPLDCAPDRANISVYARHRDYHDVLKKKLKALARWIADVQKTEVKVFVDTAPVMEKPLAQAAGIGWQGKHTNLVSRELGSWLFLGEVFLAMDLDADAAVPGSRAEEARRLRVQHLVNREPRIADRHRLPHRNRVARDAGRARKRRAHRHCCRGRRRHLAGGGRDGCGRAAAVYRQVVAGGRRRVLANARPGRQRLDLRVHEPRIHARDDQPYACCGDEARDNEEADGPLEIHALILRRADSMAEPA